MSGFVLIHRKVYEHPIFQDLQEACAFVWMVSRAAWQGHRVRYKSTVIDLERGQFSASHRDLGKRLGWSESKVRRFFEKLKNDGMIDTHTDAGVTVVTICNYDEYQVNQATCDAGDDAPPTQDRRTADAPPTHRENKGNKLNKIINQDRMEGAAAPASQPSKYAFCGRVVKIDHHQFDQWKAAYHTLDMLAELTSLDAFYLDKGAPSNWFIRTSNALAKKHEANIKEVAAVASGQKTAPIFPGYVPMHPGAGG